VGSLAAPCLHTLSHTPCPLRSSLLHREPLLLHSGRKGGRVQILGRNKLKPDTISSLLPGFFELKPPKYNGSPGHAASSGLLAKLPQYEGAHVPDFVFRTLTSPHFREGYRPRGGHRCRRPSPHTCMSLAHKVGRSTTSTLGTTRKQLALRVLV